MKFVCLVDMDDAAFEYNPREELSRILKKVSLLVLVRANAEGPIMDVDVNGAKIGSWEVLR